MALKDFRATPQIFLSMTLLEVLTDALEATTKAFLPADLKEGWRTETWQGVG